MIFTWKRFLVRANIRFSRFFSHSLRMRRNNTCAIFGHLKCLKFIGTSDTIKRKTQIITLIEKSISNAYRFQFKGLHRFFLFAQSFVNWLLLTIFFFVKFIELLERNEERTKISIKLNVLSPTVFPTKTNVIDIKHQLNSIKHYIDRLQYRFDRSGNYDGKKNYFSLLFN